MPFSLPIPLLDLHSQLAPIRQELLDAMTEVLDSGQYILGQKVEALEEAVADLVGTRYAVGVSSGTDALLVVLDALGVGHGDVVLTSDFSFFASAGVIARLGATPIFVDIDPITYNLSPIHLQKTLEQLPDVKKVKAIMPVHLYGQCASMQEILAIAKSYNLPVVEDAAQAIGATMNLKGQLVSAGSMGICGCFSFFPSKNLGVLGDGGMVTTNDQALATLIKQKRMHGESQAYQHETIGGNFRLDPLQAAVALVKLPHLKTWQNSRADNANYYRQLFLQNNLEHLCPTEVHQGGHVYNQFVIRTPKRDALQTFLQNKQIASRVYYPIPFHKQPCFQKFQQLDGIFPESLRASQEVLALPVYPELSKDAQHYIVESIAGFFASHPD